MNTVQFEQGAMEPQPRILAPAFKDLGAGLSSWRIAMALAVEDLRSRYMRSLLGISWIFISFAFFVGVKVLIFMPLANKDPQFFAPYVAVGFFAWTFMQASIVDGCRSFVTAQRWIQGLPMPLSTFAFQVVFRNIILSGVNLLVVIAILAISGHKLPPTTFLSFLVIPLFVINAVWVVLLFSTIGARYRDFVHFIQTIMRVMFFLTPIFWLPEQMGEIMKYLVWNPLTHFIFIMRDPIIYGTFPMTSFWIVLTITIVGSVLALGAFAYGRRKVVFWL